jgi:DNA-binding NarL/FixJ family response regulator
MFRGCCGVTLASMSQTDWSDVGMTDQLPTGMATLLLADVEGSTRLWESQSKEMAAAVARLDEVLTEVVGQHQGVVRLAREGLGNKEIAARLFVSPRTVQAHLSHVYAKLGVSSRVQLAQEASRH